LVRRELQRGSKDIRHKAGRPVGPDLHPALPNSFPFTSEAPPRHSYLVLFGITVLILLPFSGKAYHIDDTLFLFTAKQIANHPLDPYGFEVVWNKTAQRMSDVTENPPLASYYAALFGRVAGWSERVMHLVFLVPALALVLGTYRLGQRCTSSPILAALAALLTPGVLVSATSVMCDTMMVAFWIWAVVLWVEGLDPCQPYYLLASSLLIAATALTKYYGLALIPLLVTYSLVRLRRFGSWMLFLLIPVLALLAYEVWTGHLYGEGLIEAAAAFAAQQREFQQGSTLSHALISLSFAGGCAASALTLLPILWSPKQILAGAVVSVFAALALTFNWVDFGARVNGPQAAQSLMDHALLVSTELALCILSGFSILVMAIADVWARRSDATSWLLALWVLGTFFFAGFVNWTVNGRSVLPMIPVVGLLICRRLERIPGWLSSRPTALVAVGGLAAAGVLALVVTGSDATWANSAREAANRVYGKTRLEHGTVHFVGHWGFQYYMQALGFIPGDEQNYRLARGDLLIVPLNNTELAEPAPEVDLVLLEQLEVAHGNFVTTMSADMGAGFYSSYWGPLPFAFGRVPPERYNILRVLSQEGGSSPNH